MREIKFRAWDAKQGKMLPSIDLSAPRSTYKWLGSTDLPLMQYTGLKDKNGVEIYEGDILTGEFGKDTVELEEYHLEGGGTAICYVYSQSPLNQGLVDECDIEVIGNIYESLELLKGRL